MGNAGNASRESAVLEEPSGGNKDSTERRRNVASYAIGVASGIATFVLEILQFSPLIERLLSCFVAIALAGVIAEMIRAWPVIRQYKVMLTCAAVAFICLGILAVVVPSVDTAQPATDAPYTPVPSASTSPVASPNGSSATASVGSGTGSPTSGNSPVSSNGYAPEYSGQGFSIPGGGCDDNSYYPYVLFTAQTPYSDANDYNSSLDGPDGTYDNGAYDIYLDCFDRQIDFYGQAAIFSGKPDAEACAKRINSYPIAGGTLDFSQLSAGMQFCLLGADGNNLVYVKLLTVSDTSYTTTWVATAWNIPANN